MLPTEPPAPPLRPTVSPSRVALRVMLIYALCGTLWIALSDQLVEFLASGTGKLTMLQTLKGWFYIAATALLLFIAIRGYLVVVARGEKALLESEQRHRQLAESRRVLINELDHRVKNNLAVLHSLVSLDAKTAKDVGVFAKRMQGKIMAMKLVHELLAAANWERVDLERLMREMSRLAQPGSAEIRREGPSIMLTPKQAGTLAMILTELLVYIPQQGAGPDSGASIRWHRAALPQGGEQAEFTWRFAGTQTIDNETIDLIQSLAQFDMEGTAQVVDEPAGRRFVMRFPIADPEPSNHPNGATRAA